MTASGQRDNPWWTLVDQTDLTHLQVTWVAANQIEWVPIPNRCQAQVVKEDQAHYSNKEGHLPKECNQAEWEEEDLCQTEDKVT